MSLENFNPQNNKLSPEQAAEKFRAERVAIDKPLTNIDIGGKELSLEPKEEGEKNSDVTFNTPDNGAGAEWGRPVKWGEPTVTMNIEGIENWGKITPEKAEVATSLSRNLPFRKKMEVVLDPAKLATTDPEKAKENIEKVEEVKKEIEAQSVYLAFTGDPDAEKTPVQRLEKKRSKDSKKLGNVLNSYFKSFTNAMRQSSESMADIILGGKPKPKFKDFIESKVEDKTEKVELAKEGIKKVESPKAEAESGQNPRAWRDINYPKEFKADVQKKISEAQVVAREFVGLARNPISDAFESLEKAATDPTANAEVMLADLSTLEKRLSNYQVFNDNVPASVRNTPDNKKLEEKRLDAVQKVLDIITPMKERFASLSDVTTPVNKVEAPPPSEPRLETKPVKSLAETPVEEKKEEVKAEKVELPKEEAKVEDKIEVQTPEKRRDPREHILVLPFLNQEQVSLVMNRGDVANQLEDILNTNRDSFLALDAEGKKQFLTEEINKLTLESVGTSESIEATPEKAEIKEEKVEPLPEEKPVPEAKLNTESNIEQNPVTISKHILSSLPDNYLNFLRENENAPELLSAILTKNMDAFVSMNREERGEFLKKRVRHIARLVKKTVE